MSALDKLVNDLSGERWTVTGPDGGECTAVAHEWERRLGLPIVYGNAIDTYANAPDASYEKTRNTPTNVPQPGAILAWGKNAAVGTGVNGHTSVFLGGDQYSFNSLDQNWPTGSPCRTVHHDYRGVIGWFYPKVLNNQPTNQGEPPMNQQQEKQAYEIVLQREPEGPTSGRTGFQFILDAQAELADQRAGTKAQFDNLNGQISDLKAKVATGSDTQLLNSFGEILAKLIARIGLKK